MTFKLSHYNFNYLWWNCLDTWLRNIVNRPRVNVYLLRCNAILYSQRNWNFDEKNYEIVGQMFDLKLWCLTNRIFVPLKLRQIFAKLVLWNFKIVIFTFYNTFAFFHYKCFLSNFTKGLMKVHFIIWSLLKLLNPYDDITVTGSKDSSHRCLQKNSLQKKRLVKMSKKTIANGSCRKWKHKPEYVSLFALSQNKNAFHV